MEFLAAPVPVWAILAGIFLLLTAFVVVVFSIKTPTHEEPPHP